MRTVKQVSRLTGVSVRTLHYYDAIGLLKPTKVTEAGYRLYDDAALSRLQTILLFRELQFPLKQIKAIVDNPQFDQSEAIAQQIRLLELQYQHIGALISFAREIQSKGVQAMKFDVFDTSELEQYKAEAMARWGDTTAYQQYERKAATQTADPAQLASGMMRLFAEIGSLKHTNPADEAVQQKIAALQNYITAHYYMCTDDILRGLGDMYVVDARFQRNIDNAGGAGTAAFVQQAIGIYCGK